MSAVTIRAEHRGLSVDVMVSTDGTADDYALVLNRALRAVGAALTTEATYTEPRPDFYDGDADDATKPIAYG